MQNSAAVVGKLRKLTFRSIWPLMVRYSKTPWAQRRWEDLHLLSLAGMNVGRGGSVETSGECAVVERVLAAICPSEPAVVFDVGAHVGDYAQVVLRRLAQRAQRGTVFAFEPSPRTFARLQQNLGHHPELCLQQCGLGDKDEQRTLYSDPRHPGLESVYARQLADAGIHMDEQQRIHLRTLDGFVQAENIKHIHLLKLDAEGHEMAILQGARRTLQAGAIGAIQFEFGGCNIDSRSYFKDFFYTLRPQYHLFRVLQNGLFPIPRYREMYELFAPTNFLALARA